MAYYISLILTGIHGMEIFSTFGRILTEQLTLVMELKLSSLDYHELNVMIVF